MRPILCIPQADVTHEALCQPGGAVSHIMHLQANGTPHVNNSIMALQFAHLPFNQGRSMHCSSASGAFQHQVKPGSPALFQVQIVQGGLDSP